MTEPPAIIWTTTDVAYHRGGVRLMAFPPVAEAAADAWLVADNRLSGIRRLDADWDGDGATAPAVELTDSVQHLLARLREEGRPAPTRIVPTADGTIAIEWHEPSAFISLEVSQPYEGDWLSRREGYPTAFWTDRWSPLPPRGGTRVSFLSDEVTPVATRGYAGTALTAV